MVIVKTDCETDGSSEAIVVCDNKQCGKKETMNYTLKKLIPDISSYSQLLVDEDDVLCV